MTTSDHTPARSPSSRTTPVERSAVMASTQRLGPVARRFGYSVAIFVNLVILYLLNIRPGWEAAPFLTATTPRLLALVNLSLLTGVVANAIYVIADGQWVKTFGDLTTTAISLAVLIRAWQVFPFDFSAWTVDWGLVVRTVVVVALVGTGMALIVHSMTLLRLVAQRLGLPGTGGHVLR
jgi:hypothetical protein